MIFIVIEAKAPHEEWTKAVEVFLIRVSHTLIPATAVALVILEAAVILARYLFDDDKRSREEERLDRMEKMLEIIVDDIKERRKDGITCEESDTDQHS